MHRAQEQVRDFHRACRLGHPRVPTVDWDKIKGVRTNCMKEELAEMLEAIERHDLIQTIHEGCDVLYVVYGTFVEMGVDAQPFFDEVHGVNMTKAGGPQREDGKQLKPPNWMPADLRRVWRETYNADPSCRTGGRLTSVQRPL